MDKVYSSVKICWVGFEVKMNIDYFILGLFSWYYW